MNRVSLRFAAISPGDFAVLAERKKAMKARRLGYALQPAQAGAAA
ncbi:hypothetical protein [Cupriavidus neocaledonicus]|nr:hypothetical protein [Cupriavidus neocaledonicus]